MLGSAGCLIVPTHLALKLRGRGERIAEFGYHARRADDMTRHLGLPEAWGHWRR